MALKAVYIGVKKSMLGLINKLASSKLIKTVGDGLTLTSAGTLKANIDTDTMEIVNHKLASKGGMTVDVLFTQEPGQVPATIELLAPYTDYKVIVFGVYETENATYNDMYGKNIFLADQIEAVRTGSIAGQKTATIQLLGWEKDAHYAKYRVDSTTVFTRVIANVPPAIIKVYGIK